MTGRELEFKIVDILKANGCWAHRISPNEAGQQPFDIIAVRGSMSLAYDAKVLSNGYRFPLSRVEDNQLMSFGLFEKASCGCSRVGCLIYVEEDKTIRFLSYRYIKMKIAKDAASVDVRGLPVWEVLGVAGES